MPKYKITASYEDGRAIYDATVEAPSPKEALEKAAAEIRPVSVVDVSADVKVYAASSPSAGTNPIVLDKGAALDTDKTMG